MKRFRPCIFCGKPVRQFSSKPRRFCSRYHYNLFIKLSQAHSEAKNEFLRAIRREKPALVAP